MFNPKTHPIILDISFWQDSPVTPETVDFNKMKETGALGVILRTGQGAREDSKFQIYKSGCLKISFPYGVYWFYDSRVDPIAQAEAFVHMAGNERPALGFWLDYEEVYGGFYKGIKNFRKFSEHVERLVLTKFSGTSFVGIYTGPSYWITNGPKEDSDFAYFKAMPLWIANYETTSPLIPKPWDTYLLWQYEWRGGGEMYGVEGENLDKNVFNGTREDCIRFFSLDVEPEPLPEEKQMTYIMTVNTSSLNGRSSPNGTIVFPGGFKLGDILVCSEYTEEANGVTRWYLVNEAWRNGVKITLPISPLYAGNGGTQNLIKTGAILENTQTVPQQAEITLTIQSEGYTPEQVTLFLNKPL
jgi:GH25 family lysozyme M1 (1,4-beta-N-acetylmuramidase)